MHRNNQLGSLVALPPEIRQQIWEYFISQTPGSDSPYLVTKRRLRKNRKRLALVRVSRQIHEEVTRLLYGGRDLVFTIPPSAYSDPDPMVRLHHTRLGDVKMPSLSRDCQDARDLREERIGCRSWQLYERMSLQLFKTIRIEVYAPSPEEPGELIRAWKSLRRLDNFLMWFDTGSLPPIHFIALQDASVSWFTGNRLQTLWKGQPVRWDCGGDLGMYLIALWTHVRCKGTEIHALEGAGRFLQDQFTRNLGFAFEPLQRISGAPGCVSAVIRENVREHFEDNSRGSFSRLDEQFDALLDCLLDGLPGRCAAMLRLWRLLEWDLFYEWHSMDRITACARADREKLQKALEERWALVRAYKSRGWFYWMRHGIPHRGAPKYWSNEYEKCLVQFKVVVKRGRCVDYLAWEPRHTESSIGASDLVN